MLAGILIVTISLLFLFILFQNRDKSEDTTEAIEPDACEPAIEERMKEPEIWSRLSQENAAYVNSVIQKDPIMYPKTKGAISRMAEADRNAYHNAVADLRQRIGKEPVPVHAFYQARNLEKYSRMLLLRSLKKDDAETAKICALNLFYSMVCISACFTDLSMIPEQDLWLRDHGDICLNLTYFRIGRIIGKRGDQDVADTWAEEYGLIGKALDPDGIVKTTTDWRQLRNMAEGLRLNPEGIGMEES